MLKRTLQILSLLIIFAVAYSHDNEKNEFKSYTAAIANPIAAEILYLKNNASDSINSDILKLKNLKTIYFVKSNLKSLPNEVAHLESLEEIHFYNNPKIDYNMLAFQLLGMKNLKHIYIKDKMDLAPTSLQNLKSLEKISFVDCNLKEFPKFLCDMPNIIEIDLSGNEIDTLPACIIKSDNLRRLNLTQNKLKILPKNFWKMDSLRYLNISFNQFEDFGKFFLKYANFDTLDIRGNRFKPKHRKLFSFAWKKTHIIF